jgi:hypothetical protein
MADSYFEENYNVRSIWHNLEICNSCKNDLCVNGFCEVVKDINIDDYVEYCKTIDQYVIGKNWYGKEIYGYNFEFKLKSDKKVYNLNTNLIMSHSFENKWHWTPVELDFEVVCSGVLEKKIYDFIQKDVELIDELKDYQLVARSICYYSGLPFKSGK